jgi:hypothetical protein
MLRIKSPENLAAAVLLIVLGAAGAVFSGDLRMGTASRMGPGYFPVVLSWCIIGCGITVGLQAFVVDGPRLDRASPRPLLFVAAAILAFGFLIDHLGLALTAAAVTLLISYAQPRRNVVEALLLAVALSAFVVGVFAYALGLPVPVWMGR